MLSQKELVLLKEGERYIFKYESGSEEEVLDSFVDMANNRANNFDWFDAAVLSFQLSKQLVDEADGLLCPADPNYQSSTTESGEDKVWFV